MFVEYSRTRDPRVTRFEVSRDLLSGIRRRLRRKWISRAFAPYERSRPAGYEPFQDCRSPYAGDLERKLPPADVVNLHWIANGFLDYESFFAQVPRQTPVVWTLHDMNAFTGGCHYDMGCDRYLSQCGNCPQLGSNEPDDLSSRIWGIKLKAFSQVPPGRVHFVAPSRWLAGELRRSALGNRFPVSVIPYGLDLDDFAPRDQRHARAVLGLPEEAAVVLFVADGLDNRRKGFGVLAAALSDKKTLGKVSLLSVGHGDRSLIQGLEWKHLGSIENDRLLSLVYSAADLFVIPSLQDNLPNTVLESLACGTPVVGFAVGGIPEAVREGVTGRVVPPNDIEGLRQTLQSLLCDRVQLSDMRKRCRRVAEEEYGLERQANRYSELYHGLLKG